jgi:hypothetical protein
LMCSFLGACAMACWWDTSLPLVKTPVRPAPPPTGEDSGPSLLHEFRVAPTVSSMGVEVDCLEFEAL